MSIIKIEAITHVKFSAPEIPRIRKSGARLPEAMKRDRLLKAQARRPRYLRIGQTVEAEMKSNGGANAPGIQQKLVSEQGRQA
ncbi:hypothetical protein [Sphingorhabdus sp. M41]|uniref:hypothetical protein n=1 Tax=Sphingorhabdus sp. M41 TaxID=1806885 RepID=UPI00078C155A|nr:hypothetical protein [Sphingorhabdus sp. M41]AMO72014.1 hypothetical protein AZE99_09290 [Sphingorhabdus sp. M41]